MESKPTYQHEYQGSEAQGYEARRTRDAKWQAEDEALTELLDAALSGPSQVLDVPVGTGRFLRHYAERGHVVVGADISQDMLREARQKLVGSVDHDVTLEVADITALGYADDTFDMAICVRLLNLVDADVVAAALSELARVARTHVIVGIRTYDPLSAPYQFVRWCRNRLTGRTAKVNPHPAGLVRRLAAGSNLTLVRRVQIDRGARRSSVYHLYLFQVGGPQGS